MNTFMNEKVMPAIVKVIGLKPMQALKDGILYSMPLLIIGSIFLLLANLPIPSVATWINESGLGDVFNQAYNSTFNIMAIVAVMGISYTYVKNEKFASLPASVIALACFILLQPASILGEDGNPISVILKDWTAGKGMICAIIVGLFTGWMYSLFMKKDIRIKMPDGVPSGVADSFSALVPGLAIIGVATLVYTILKFGFDTTFVDWIYATIQTPLQGLTDTFGGAVLISFLVPFLWMFGVHGASLVAGVVEPLLLANSTANQAILDSGKALTLANGGHIVTEQFWGQCLTITGTGITLGLVIYFCFFAKSSQFKQIGRLGIVPSVFNINEPILFGTPIVLNPVLAVPFLLMPVIACVLQYVAIYTGICPMYGGIIVPWTMPAILSGFLVGGWKTALLQFVVLVISFFLYLPFARKLDQMNYEQEQQALPSDK